MPTREGSTLHKCHEQQTKNLCARWNFDGESRMVIHRGNNNSWLFPNTDHWASFRFFWLDTIIQIENRHSKLILEKLITSIKKVYKINCCPFYSECVVICNTWLLHTYYLDNWNPVEVKGKYNPSHQKLICPNEVDKVNKSEMTEIEIIEILFDFMKLREPTLWSTPQ